MIPYRRWALDQPLTPVHYARYYFLRLLTQPWQRRAGSALIARAVRLRLRRARAAVEPHGAAAETMGTLRRDGVVPVPALLDAARIDDVLAYLADKPLWADGRRIDGDAAARGVPRASYDASTILRCPHLVDALNARPVLDIAETYLGCRPTLSALGLNWSYPQHGAPASVQTFHRDTEAWRLLNLFVYLTDVDEAAGPHEYVRGSHRTEGRLRIRPYDEGDILRRYGPSSVLSVRGRRGTSFVEDGWGIHRGLPPTAQPRLMLAAMYSLGPIPLYRYEPVTLATRHGHDRYVNRLMLA